MSFADKHLATLMYSWEELDALAQLIDDRLNPFPLSDWNSFPEFVMLNSLRTSLREAQYSLRNPNTDTDTEPSLYDICRGHRWKSEQAYYGDHEPHLFTYGPNNMYTGSCVGWPRP